MSETHPPSRIGQSIAAVIAGMLVGIVIALGTDVVLHAVGVFPPWGASRPRKPPTKACRMGLSGAGRAMM